MYPMKNPTFRESPLMFTADRRHPLFPLLLALLAMVAGSVICGVITTPADSTAQIRQAEPQGPDSRATAHEISLGGDWPQWGGTSVRNNTPTGTNIPSRWDAGEFDRKTGEWIQGSGDKVKWVSRLGSQTYGNPVVADGRVYVGTNNSGAYLARYPGQIDLGCLLAFDVEDGRFLWQHSSEKLSTGRVHDWPLQGICCAPLVEGDRLWFVTSRGEVVCLDSEGYYDGEDDGPQSAGNAKLFAESVTITEGLDDGTLNPAIEALLKDSGVATDGRIRINGEGGTWTMRITTKESVTHYRLTLDSPSDQLQVARLATEEDPSDGEVICTTPIDLIAGLTERTPSPALLSLLSQRGAALENPMVSVAGKGWQIEGRLDGRQRTVSIAKRGPKVVATLATSVDDTQEADEVWVYDMMAKLSVSQHNMCSCSVTSLGDMLFVNTSNGVDESHINIPSVEAPSFIALDKNTGELLWSDASPGANILHGQWSSPTVGAIGGVSQAIFAGGDGWVYSFRADRGQDGNPELLWKFDANPKTSEWILGGRGTRNNIIGTPVVLQNRVYIAVGQDPEHGEGEGHLWCLDGTKRGDISAELAVHVDDRSQPIAPRRLRAVDEEEGEVAIDNPNSGVVWHYSTYDQNGDGEIDFEETMHRSCGTVAIKKGLLCVADFSGLFHCLDANSGRVLWTYDLLSAAWGSPLIVEDKVYIGDEDGMVSVFPLSGEKEVALRFDEEEDEWKPALGEIDMRNSVYSTPVIANNVMYISNKTHLFAIGQ
jgi:outer membrane protein assembly factor BamB